MRKLQLLFLLLFIVAATVLIVRVRRELYNRQQQAALLQPLQVLQLPNDVAKEIKVAMTEDVTVIVARGEKGIYRYGDAIAAPTKVEILHENPELVALDPSGYYVAAVADRVIHLWNVRSGVKLSSIIPNLDIQLLTWASPSWPYLAAWGATHRGPSNANPNYHLKLWSIDEDPTDGEVDWETGEFDVCAVVMYPHTPAVIIADDDKKFTGGCPQSPTVKYNALAVNRQYDLFAMAGYTRAKILGLDGQERVAIELPFKYGNTISLWTEANHSGEFVDWLIGSVHLTNFLKFSTDGLLLLSDGLEGHGFQIWDVNSEELLHTLAHSAAPLNGSLNEAIFINTYGQEYLLATASGDEVVKLWEPYSGELLLDLPGHSGGVVDVAVDWNARRLVTLDETGKIFVWDLYSIIRKRLLPRLEKLVHNSRTYPRSTN